jgi:hypothetical protein
MKHDPEKVAAIQQAIMKHPHFDGGEVLAFGLANTALDAATRVNSPAQRSTDTIRETLAILASYEMIAVGFAGSVRPQDIKDCDWVVGFRGRQPEFRHFEAARKALADAPAESAATSASAAGYMICDLIQAVIDRERNGSKSNRLECEKQKKRLMAALTCSSPAVNVAEAVLEQIAIVCTDNMDRGCNHRMALDFVRQIANDALEGRSQPGSEKVTVSEIFAHLDQAQPKTPEGIVSAITSKFDVVRKEPSNG